MDAGALLLLASVAGYGDPDAAGRPTWAERDVHAWTNAVRVDPEAFAADYAYGGCSFESFSTTEKTSQRPLHHSPALNEAAAAHSQDMYASGSFSHNSSDGTSFYERVTAYYGAYAIGENIAWNYPGTYAAVTQGWMCSNDHRENIMSPDWTELGTGVADVYYTQDFGAAPAGTWPVAMGTHRPETPGSSAEFTVDWADVAAPQKLVLVLDGQHHPVELLYGSETQGVYGATIDLASDGEKCHEYYFFWATADNRVGAFPEEGSYLFGACEEPTMWAARQLNRGPLSAPLEDDSPAGGCSALPGAGSPRSLGGLGLIAGVIVLFLRAAWRD